MSYSPGTVTALATLAAPALAWAISPSSCCKNYPYGTSGTFLYMIFYALLGAVIGVAYEAAAWSLLVIAVLLFAFLALWPWVVRHYGLGTETSMYAPILILLTSLAFSLPPPLGAWIAPLLGWIIYELGSDSPALFADGGYCPTSYGCGT